MKIINKILPYKIKKYLRYSKLHYLILHFKNPRFISWINKEIEFHKNFLSRDKLIFDLGANKGDTAHVFSNFTKKIILYEPEENLAENLKLRFRKYKSIFINETLVTDKVGETNFYSVSGDQAYSSILSNYHKSFDHLNKNEVIVKKKITTNLNTEIKKYGLPFYIKIDCEGAEKLILKNLDYKVSIISFEVNLPSFLNDALNIIDYFKNKFDSSFNIRGNEECFFTFKENTTSDEVKKFLLHQKKTFEIFIFNK